MARQRGDPRIGQSKFLAKKAQFGRLENALFREAIKREENETRVSLLLTERIGIFRITRGREISECET
jgi:hypothetical protein